MDSPPLSPTSSSNPLSPGRGGDEPLLPGRDKKGKKIKLSKKQKQEAKKAETEQSKLELQKKEKHWEIVREKPVDTARIQLSLALKIPPLYEERVTSETKEVDGKKVSEKVTFLDTSKRGKFEVSLWSWSLFSFHFVLASVSSSLTLAQFVIFCSSFFSAQAPNGACGNGPNQVGPGCP